MRALITGGAGFIGSHLARALCREHGVVVLDDFSLGNATIDSPNVETINASITDAAALQESLKGVDVVFHFAAVTGVPRSFKEPLFTMETNVLGTVKLLDAALARNVKRVVFASSASVYGDNPDNPKKELMPAQPKSPYAVSKLAGEGLCDSYRQKGLQAVSLRFFNVFGPGQKNGVVPAFVEAARQNKDFVVCGDGMQTRDFVFVDDVVKACTLAAEKGAGVYNIGSGKATQVKELAEKIIALTGSESKLVFKPERAGDVKHSQADVSLAKKEFGYAPSVSLENGLKNLLAADEV